MSDNGTDFEIPSHSNTFFITAKNDSKKWQEYAETLAVLYNHGVITVKEANLTKDLRIEPDLAEMISETGNEHILKWSWYAFRNNFTHKMRQPYIALQKLQNKYAKLNGKKSVAERWVRDYEMSLSEYKELIGQVVYDTMPLYRKLHAYVKFKLSQKYVYLHNWTHIPAHLLRNMWAQDWGHLINITLPFKELAVDSTQALKDKFKGNITALVKNVESYYVSIGFPHLPESFYNKSILEEGNLTKSVDCHASAHSMVYPRSDVRFKMCGKIDRDIFYTATHEMGHAYYYLSYSNQTFLFYNSPNPAFHESIGDTIALMSNGLTHFQKTHLLTRPKKKLQARMQRMNYLMLAALEKIPIIFFSYVIDKWVFDFYEDKVPESNMNGHWWYLVKTYQGIVPPNGEERGEEFFDVGAKYHVANLRYIYTRYQLARLLQFEFLRQLCKEDLTKGVPFDLCDAEGKVKATRRFREMLTLGASESWREQLKFVTNGEKDYFDTKVMLQYFKPLELWLDQFLKLNKISVGWQ